MLAVTPKCNPTLYINHHENKSARITELRDFVKKRIKMNHGGGGHWSIGNKETQKVDQGEKY